MDRTVSAEFERLMRRVSEQTQILTGTDRVVGFYPNTPWTLSALDRLVTNDKELTERDRLSPTRAASVIA
jgi:hypothetical protein